MDNDKLTNLLRVTTTIITTQQTKMQSSNVGIYRWKKNVQT